MNSRPKQHTRDQEVSHHHLHLARARLPGYLPDTLHCAWMLCRCSQPLTRSPPHITHQITSRDLPLRPGEETKQQPMAAPPIVVERFRVEHGSGFTMSVISLPDRRAAGNQIVRFVYQRHLEAVLYGRVEGTSGPIWKLMNQSGMGSTVSLSVYLLRHAPLTNTHTHSFGIRPPSATIGSSGRNPCGKRVCLPTS